MADKNSMNITQLTPEAAAKVLAYASRRPITVEMIRKDIESGAPVNPDGTISLINYAAWLVTCLRQGYGGQGEMANAD